MNCVACGADTDGKFAVFTNDEDGNEIKWPLCHGTASPTCYERWTSWLPRTSH